MAKNRSNIGNLFDDEVAEGVNIANALFVTSIVKKLYTKFPGDNMVQLIDLARRIIDIDSKIDEKKAKDFLEGRAVSVTQRILCLQAMLKLIDKHRSFVMQSLSTINDAWVKNANTYIDVLLQQNALGAPPVLHVGTRGALPTAYSEFIFSNWKRTHRGREYVISGIYQLFRRYKPPHSQEWQEQKDMQQTPPKYDWRKPENHVVICEIVYIDSDAMECILITARQRIYIGTMFINHENMLNVVLQRKAGNGTGVNQRFFAHALDKQDTKVFSAVAIKSGDTSRMPVASECLFIRVPRDAHENLYNEMTSLRADLRSQPFAKTSLGEGSVVANYISDRPPNAPYDPDDPGPEWRRVQFVRNFPGLTELVKASENVAAFREPLRALSKDRIFNINASVKFPVFTQSASKEFSEKLSEEMDSSALTSED